MGKSLMCAIIAVLGAVGLGACGARQGEATEPAAAGATEQQAPAVEPLTELSPEVMGRFASGELRLADFVDPGRGVAFIWGGSVEDPSQEEPEPYELQAHEELVAEGIVRGSVRACGAELESRLATAHQMLASFVQGQPAQDVFTCEGTVCTRERATEWDPTVVYTFQPGPDGRLVLEMVDMVERSMLAEPLQTQLAEWATAERARLAAASCAE